jgi:hypothetical protein
MTNNLVGPPPNLLNNKVMQGGLNKQKMENSFEPNKYEPLQNRYHSSNQGIGKQRE